MVNWPGRVAGEGGRGETWPPGGPSGRRMGVGRGVRVTARKRPFWCKVRGGSPGVVQETGDAGTANDAPRPTYSNDRSL